MKILLAAALASLATAAVKPPPAWMTSASGRHKLGYSSFCWHTRSTGVCADFVAPRCGMHSVPTIAVRRGETVRFEVGFTPSSVQLSVHGRLRKLAVSRQSTWLVDRSGVLSLFVQAKGRGDATYTACLVFR